jgi:hypothetical protein
MNFDIRSLINCILDTTKKNENHKKKSNRLKLLTLEQLHLRKYRVDNQSKL